MTNYTMNQSDDVIPNICRSLFGPDEHRWQMIFWPDGNWGNGEEDGQSPSADIIHPRPLQATQHSSHLHSLDSHFLCIAVGNCSRNGSLPGFNRLHLWFHRDLSLAFSTQETESRLLLWVFFSWVRIRCPTKQLVLDQGNRRSCWWIN